MSSIIPLETASAVINRLEGPTKAARLIGCTAAAVSNWRKAGVFPSDKYVLMQDLLASRGFSAPASLWQMTPRPSEQGHVANSLAEAS